MGRLKRLDEKQWCGEEIIVKSPHFRPYKRPCRNVATEGSIYCTTHKDIHDKEEAAITQERLDREVRMADLLRMEQLGFPLENIVPYIDDWHTQHKFIISMDDVQEFGKKMYSLGYQDALPYEEDDQQ